MENSAVVGDPRDDVTDYIRTKEFKLNTMLALRVLINDIGTEMAQFKELAEVPHERVRNFRNDMYLVSEALRLVQRSGKPTFAAADLAVLKNYKGHIDKATRFIPLWVKIAVALALGLGAMVGWKRSSSQAARKSARTISPTRKVVPRKSPPRQRSAAPTV